MVLTEYIFETFREDKTAYAFQLKGLSEYLHLLDYEVSVCVGLQVYVVRALLLTRMCVNASNRPIPYYPIYVFVDCDIVKVVLRGVMR